jgi:hypothetical protein
LLPEVWPELRLVAPGALWHVDPDFDWDAAERELRLIQAAVRVADDPGSISKRESPQKRGTKSAKTRKIDVAITLIVRDPELPDAEIARRAKCTPGYLSKSTDYQRNASVARAALVRAQRSVTFNQRTCEHEALDD